MASFINEFNIVVLLFIITYFLIVLNYKRKNFFIWTFISIVLLFGVISPIEAFRAINWNVIGIYIGMLFVSEIFVYSQAPHILAEKIVSKSSKVWVIMIGICLISGILSIAIENVAVVLIVAPIALFVAKELKINPAPMLIGIALMSNLEGVSTMIGDPPSLLLANYAGLNFMDFFIFHGKLSLFFAVQIAAIVSLIVLYYFFRKYNSPSKKVKIGKLKSFFPTFILFGMVFLLAGVSLVSYSGTSNAVKFLDNNKLGLISILSGIVVWVWYQRREKKDFLPFMERLDWSTGLFLIGVFILVQSLIKVGFIKYLAFKMALITGDSIFGAYFLIIFFSVCLSAFIDNVPFIAAMLPVVGNLAQIMNVSPYLFYFGLVIGASVGGNITPVGASANIVAMGILKKEGKEPTFWEFVKIGLPLTLAATIVSTAFVWFVFR